MVALRNRPSLAAALLVGLSATAHGAKLRLDARTPWSPSLSTRVAGSKDAAATANKKKAYMWPSGRGHLGHYGVSADVSAPFQLDQHVGWRWHHPLGKYHTLTYGTVIDDRSNIYLCAADAVRKFDVNGVLIWEHSTLPAEMPNVGSLASGMFFSCDTHGNVFALSIDTGAVVWKRKICDEIAQDNGFVTVSEGVVVAGTNARNKGSENQVVRALKASDGSPLWEFKPDVNVWNFMASFPGDGTAVFQDQSGKAYRVALADGRLLWKAGGADGTWTDGTATLGSNNVLYTVNNVVPGINHAADEPGRLTARRLEDGAVLWTRNTSRPPNNAQAVGRLAGSKTRLSVVLPMGQQMMKGAPTDVVAFDAETGKQRWIFRGPSQKGDLQAGDKEGILMRSLGKVRPICAPNPWSAPTIDASGTVFVGNQEGNFYALRDMNGDGVVEGPEEVAFYDTRGAFSGSAGPSLAPGLVAVASCDSLYVFRNGTAHPPPVTLHDIMAGFAKKSSIWR